MRVDYSLCLDTYQYFLHRSLHEVKFLYKHFHSVHHRLYVPFAFGALYSHPVEGAFLDGLGVVLVHSIVGMSERQAIILFGFATYKSVEDHCGYHFPWHPIHTIFGNNSEYHDIHHQVREISLSFMDSFFLLLVLLMSLSLASDYLLFAFSFITASRY